MDQLAIGLWPRPRADPTQTKANATLGLVFIQTTTTSVTLASFSLAVVRTFSAILTTLDEGQTHDAYTQHP